MDEPEIVAPEAPAATPPPEAPRAPAVAPSSITARPSVSVRHSPEPAPPSSEAQVLGDAFRELRTRGDAAAALRALEEYDRRFPAGALRSEARVARAEALLALDRRRDALPSLEGLEASGATPTREVRVTRGELLAEAGRCPDAVRDFDAVLAAGERDAAGARALYGRASCRSRAGDGERARQDLRRYLLLHPGGPFARPDTCRRLYALSCARLGRRHGAASFAASLALFSGRSHRRRTQAPVRILDNDGGLAAECRREALEFVAGICPGHL